MKTIMILTAAFLVICAAFSCAADVDYKTGSYPNIQRLILYNSSSDHLENPFHDMSEGITFDQSKITTGSSGVSLQSGAVAYSILLDYVPSGKLMNASGYYIDYAYRGRSYSLGKNIMSRK